MRKQHNRKMMISEEKLRRIVNDSVQELLDEAYSDMQYAHLAGQADSALNSLGGRIKGLFFPNWKARKLRQRGLFANQAVGDTEYHTSSTSGGDHNFRDTSVDLYGRGRGEIKNKYNDTPQKGQDPFEIRQRGLLGWGRGRNPSVHHADGPVRNVIDGGEGTFSRDDLKDLARHHPEHAEDIRKLEYANWALNRAYWDGQQRNKKYK